MTEVAGREATVPGEGHHLTISPETMGSESLQEHSPSVNDDPADETANSTGPDRSALIFSINEGKGRHPGYLTLDKALDQYGIMLFPDEWGRIPYWDQIPFILNKDQLGYTKPRIEKTAHSKKKRLVSVALIAPEGDHPLLKRCAEVYWQVCRQFRKSLRKKTISLYGSDPLSSKKSKIVDRGILTARRIEILYTGSVRLKIRKGRVTRCRLFVDKRTYNHWIWPQVYEPLTNVLKSTIDNAASGKGYEITKDIWHEFIAPVFTEYKLGSLRRFMKENVFDQLHKRKGKGRPDKLDKHTFKMYMDELTGAIRLAITRFQAELSDKPRLPDSKNPEA